MSTTLRLTPLVPTLRLRVLQGVQGATGATGATGPGYAATSTTSIAIASSGSKAFTTQSGLAYSAGARVRVSDAAAPSTNYMEGVVTSYSGTTLTLRRIVLPGRVQKQTGQLILSATLALQGPRARRVPRVVLVRRAQPDQRVPRVTREPRGRATLQHQRPALRLHRPVQNHLQRSQGLPIQRVRVFALPM